MRRGCHDLGGRVNQLGWGHKAGLAAQAVGKHTTFLNIGTRGGIRDIQSRKNTLGLE